MRRIKLIPTKVRRFLQFITKLNRLSIDAFREFGDGNWRTLPGDRNIGAPTSYWNHYLSFGDAIGSTAG